MRRRLYFVLPDLESARKTEDELLLARIDEPHIHFLANDETELEELPEANLLQSSDLLHSMIVGLVTGGMTGAAAGLTLFLLPQTTDILGMGIILTVAIVGAIMGTWVSGMIGISVPNTQLKVFQPALARGEILMMVDVPKHRVGEITELLHKTHPEAEDHGMEADKPAFP